MSAGKQPVRSTRTEVARDVWYRGGLRFACTGCGNCCTGAPGYVWVRPSELERIAAFIGRRGRGLTAKHVRRLGARYSLTEDGPMGACCFLECKDGKRTCRIYPVRPLQCRTWPFWKSNLADQEAWTSASVDCAGMNDGRLHNFAEIEACRTARCWEDVPEWSHRLLK